MDLNEKRVMVVGGAGFIGSHVVDCLTESGARVMVVDNLSTGLPDNLDGSRRTVGLVDLDIERQGSVFRSALKYFEPDVVFHYAAKNVDSSIKNPEEDVRTSIIGTLNVLEGARMVEPTPKIIFASSGSVYGEPSQYLGKENENQERVPTSPYGVSKLASEEYLRVWNELYGIHYVSLRYYNVYGPRQRFGVIPIFANRLKERKDLIIDGSGKQTRPFLYVSDAAESAIKVIQLDAVSGFYNLAGGEIITILDLASKMRSALNSEVKILHGPKRLGEIMAFNPSTLKAKVVFGFDPVVKFEEGLTKYLQWRGMV